MEFPIRDGVMKEVNNSRNEQRGLIMLRNELASYVSKNGLTSRIKKNLEMGETERETFSAPHLPEPINHRNACHSCPYNTICYSFLSRDKTICLPDKHPLNELQQQTPYLTSDHIDYFIKWNGLLALEEEQMSTGKFICFIAVDFLLFACSFKENQLKNLWLRTPEMRTMHGQSIMDLEIASDVVEVEDHYLHKFKRKTGGDLINDLTLTGISTGEYLRVSTLKRIAIAAGRVIGIDKTMITISLER